MCLSCKIWRSLSLFFYRLWWILFSFFFSFSDFSSIPLLTGASLSPFKIFRQKWESASHFFLPVVGAHFLGKVCFFFFFPVFPLFVLFFFQFVCLLFDLRHSKGSVPFWLVNVSCYLRLVISIIIQSRVKSFGSWSKSRIQSHLFISLFNSFWLEKKCFLFIFFF